MHDTRLGSKDIEMLSRLLDLGELPKGRCSFFSKSHDFVDSTWFSMSTRILMSSTAGPDERVARSDTELKVRQWLDITAFIDLRDQL